MKFDHHQRFRRAVAAALVALVFPACASVHGPLGSGDPGAKPEDSTAPATTSPVLSAGESALSRKITALLSDREFDRAGAELRKEAAKGASPAEVRLLQGDIERARGLKSRAFITYAGIRGEKHTQEHLASAWSRIASLYEEEGELHLALQAALRARDAADPKQRAPIDVFVQKVMKKLPAPARAAEAERWHGADLGSALASNTLHIALLAPLSGRFENFGKAFRWGAEIALDERLASVTPQVELLVHDVTDPISSARETRRAILEEHCCAILGPLLSVPTIAAGVVADAHGVSLLAPPVSESRLADLGTCVFTLEPSADELARVLVEAAKANGIRTVVVAASEDPAFSGREKAFVRAAKGSGIAIAETIGVPAGKKDYRPQLSKAKQAVADAVYILGDPADLEIIVKQLEEFRLNKRILGHGEWADERLRGLGKRSLEGALISLEAGENPTSEFWHNLERRVRAKAGVPLSRFHVYGYAAMSEFLAAVDLGARDADEVCTMFRNRTAWPSTPAVRAITAWTWEDGAWREPVSP